MIFISFLILGQSDFVTYEGNLGGRLLINFIIFFTTRTCLLSRRLSISSMYTVPVVSKKNKIFPNA